MRRCSGRLESHSSLPQGAVTHPHVNDEQLCADDAAVPLQRALTEGRLADAFSPWRRQPRIDTTRRRCSMPALPTPALHRAVYHLHRFHRCGANDWSTDQVAPAAPAAVSRAALQRHTVEARAGRPNDRLLGVWRFPLAIGRSRLRTAWQTPLPQRITTASSRSAAWSARANRSARTRSSIELTIFIARTQSHSPQRQPPARRRDPCAIALSMSRSTSSIDSVRDLNLLPQSRTRRRPIG